MVTTIVYAQIDTSQANSAKLRDDPSVNGTRGLYFGTGDSLQIEIDTTSFPVGSVFQSIAFYPTSDESTNGASGTFAGRVSAITVGGVRIGGGSSALFIVNWAIENLTRPVFITDIEGPPNGDCAWFSIVIAAPNGTTYTLDPELVNTSGGGATGWQPTRNPTLATVILN